MILSIIYLFKTEITQIKQTINDYLTMYLVISNHTFLFKIIITIVFRDNFSTSVSKKPANLTTVN